MAQIGSEMAPKFGRRIFLKLPVRYAAIRTGPLEPFISQPARRAAVSGVGHQEGFVTMGGDPGLVADLFKGLDPVQPASARRPQFNFFDQAKKLNAFAIIAFAFGFVRFGCLDFRFNHGFLPLAVDGTRARASTAIVATPICSGSWSSRGPILSSAAAVNPNGMPGAATIV